MLIAREKPLATRPSALWRLGSLGVFTCAVVLATLAAGVRPAPGQAQPEEKPPPTETQPGVTSPPPIAERNFSIKVFESEQAQLAEKAQLGDQIKKLQDRLDALEGRARTTAAADPKALPAPSTPIPGVTVPGVPGPGLSMPRMPTVVINRIDESGDLWTEEWTVEKGQPSKLIRKTKAEPWTPSPASVPATPSGYPGKRVGPATGTGALLPKAVATAAESPAAAGSSTQLDLVTLATSYVDAVGALELAKATLADVEQLAKAKSISQREVTAARLGMQNAQRKEHLLRRIAEAAAKSAEQEFARTAALVKEGIVPASVADDARARLEILNQILNTAK